MKQIVFLTIIFLLLSCFINNKELLAFELSLNASITPRVFGGGNAELAAFGYIAQIRLGRKYICTASAIGDYQILAPARCFTHTENVIWPYIDVTIHTSTISSQSLGRLFWIRKVYVHPGWTGTGNQAHDLAIAMVSVKITTNYHHWKIKLPLENVRSNLLGWVTGWGETEPDGQISEQLIKARLWTLKFDECQQFIPRDVRLQEDQLCAYQQEGFGCSKGDRGAPLVIDDYIVGMFSWLSGASCAEADPEIYVNIFKEKDFIEYVMRRPV